MASADNRWIISSHHFKEHKTIESMETELARLQAAAPGKAFHVYRIKRTIRKEEPAEANETSNAYVSDNGQFGVGA